MYKLSGKRLSGKRFVRESDCPGKVLSGKRLIRETSCPGNVCYPSETCPHQSTSHDRISDEELHIEGYVIVRKDRKLEIKGGGVMIYVKDNLTVSEIKMENDFPEQV